MLAFCENREYIDCQMESEFNSYSSCECGFYLPNDPVSDDHHWLTACFQKVKQRLSSWLHFTECRTQDHTKHNHAKDICVAGVHHFVIQFIVIISYNMKEMCTIRRDEIS